MQWIKASELKELPKELVFYKHTHADGFEEKGAGQFFLSGEKFTGNGGSAMGSAWFDKLYILVESPPASAVEEAASMYPDEEWTKEKTVWPGGIRKELRQAHITCAGMYTGEIERLRNDVAKLEADNKALIEEIQNWKDELKHQAREHRDNR